MRGKLVALALLVAAVALVGGQAGTAKTKPKPKKPPVAKKKVTPAPRRPAPSPRITPVDHTNIVDQLEAKKLTWGAYMESMPSAGYTGDYVPSSSQQLYASKHNPFVLFSDIRNNAGRMADDKPDTALATDLQKLSTTPNFVWITPNQCHDMHGGVSTAVAADGSDATPCPFGSTKGIRTTPRSSRRRMGSSKAP
jgi:hypothetical protein